MDRKKTLSWKQTYQLGFSIDDLDNFGRKIHYNFSNNRSWKFQQLLLKRLKTDEEIFKLNNQIEIEAESWNYLRETVNAIRTLILFEIHGPLLEKNGFGFLPNGQKLDGEMKHERVEEIVNSVVKIFEPFALTPQAVCSALYKSVGPFYQSKSSSKEKQKRYDTNVCEFKDKFWKKDGLIQCNCSFKSTGKKIVFGKATRMSPSSLVVMSKPDEVDSSLFFPHSRDHLELVAKDQNFSNTNFEDDSENPKLSSFSPMYLVNMLNWLILHILVSASDDDWEDSMKKEIYHKTQKLTFRSIMRVQNNMDKLHKFSRMPPYRDDWYEELQHSVLPGDYGPMHVIHTKIHKLLQFLQPEEELSSQSSSQPTDPEQSYSQSSYSEQSDSRSSDSRSSDSDQSDY